MMADPRHQNFTRQKVFFCPSPQWFNQRTKTVHNIYLYIIFINEVNICTTSMFVSFLTFRFHPRTYRFWCHTPDEAWLVLLSDMDIDE